MGRYSGARLEEICQLHLDDIRDEGGVLVFDINEDGGKQLKTASSSRLVPVHPKLEELGLVKYVNELKSKGKDRLFPELSKQRDGYSQAVSKFFSRFRKRCGITESGKVFHSFRHTVANNLKQQSVPREKIGAILGHLDESVTTGRYGKAFEPSVLKPVIEELDFGVALDGVKKW